MTGHWAKQFRCPNDGKRWRYKHLSERVVGEPCGRCAALGAALEAQPPQAPRTFEIVEAELKAHEALFRADLPGEQDTMWLATWDRLRHELAGMVPSPPAPRELSIEEQEELGTFHVGSAPEKARP